MSKITKQKAFVLEKWVRGGTPLTVFHPWRCMCEGVGRARVVGMRNLISCMPHSIPYRIALFMWYMFGCFMYVIACAF